MPIQEAGKIMARKDIEKDADRPHYYSQFWLDVAAGRRIIGAPKPNEDEGDEEGETPITATSYRSTSDDETDDDGYNDNIVHPVAEPIEAPDDFIEPEADETDLANDEVDDADFAETDDADIPDVDLDTADEDEDEDNYFDEGEEEEEEEEEDDDLNWGRGRKKAKPSRPTKPASTKKPSRRDTRRNF
jgi:hypothetical protein